MSQYKDKVLSFRGQSLSCVVKMCLQEASILNRPTHFSPPLNRSRSANPLILLGLFHGPDHFFSLLMDPQVQITASAPSNPTNSLSPITPLLESNRLLSGVGTRANISSSPRPIHMHVLSLGVLLIRTLWLNAESMRSEVISLGLQQIRRQILGTVPVVE